MEIIILGHGHFASGLQSSLNLIAGHQEHVTAIDFIGTMSSEQLDVQLRECVKDKSDVLILCDLLGGTPFKLATMLSYRLVGKNIQVLSGTNLTMLLEAALSADSLNDQFIDNVRATACQGIVSAKDLLAPSKNKSWEDGI